MHSLRITCASQTAVPPREYGRDRLSSNAGARGSPRRLYPWDRRATAVPCISDDIEEWAELSEEEQSAIRALLEELGAECPDGEDDDYYE